MKKCKWCQTEIEEKAKVCPNCKKDLRNWFAKHPVLSVIIGLVVLSMIAGGGNKTAVNQTGNATNTVSTVAKTEAVKPEEPKKQDLEILEHKFVKEKYSSKVVGKVKNNTTKTYGYAQVEINLYDKDNTLVGSTLANINNFEAGTTWKFEAIVLKDETVTYKIKEVSGF